MKTFQEFIDEGTEYPPTVKMTTTRSHYRTMMKAANYSYSAADTPGDGTRHVYSHPDHKGVVIVHRPSARGKTWSIRTGDGSGGPETIKSEHDGPTAAHLALTRK